VGAGERLGHRRIDPVLVSGPPFRPRSSQVPPAHAQRSWLREPSEGSQPCRAATGYRGAGSRERSSEPNLVKRPRAASHGYVLPVRGITSRQVSDARRPGYFGARPSRWQHLSDSGSLVQFVTTHRGGPSVRSDHPRQGFRPQRRPTSRRPVDEGTRPYGEWLTGLNQRHHGRQRGVRARPLRIGGSSQGEQ